MNAGIIASSRRRTSGGTTGETAFIITIDTTKGDGLNSFNIPISARFDRPYDYNVDWGDGTTSTGVTTTITRTYDEPGIYDIKITGIFSRIYFNDSAVKDVLKIIDVKNWGDVEFVDFLNAFAGCANLNVSATDYPKLKSGGSFEKMFPGCTSLNFDPIGWDFTNATNLTDMFQGCTLFNGDVSGWDVSHIEIYDNMFGGCTNFNTDISGWDVSNVKTFVSMFENCSALDCDLSVWNPVSATSMIRMFRGANAMNIDLSGWCIPGISSRPSQFTSSNTNIIEPNWGEPC